MGYSNFKLNGVAIKNPHAFSMERYTLTQSTRVATGEMVMDFVANKRKFIFSWDAINSIDLDNIIELLWGQLENTRQCFLTLTYIENNKPQTAIVYAGAIPSTLHRGHGSLWVWKDVKISLIEK